MPSGPLGATDGTVIHALDLSTNSPEGWRSGRPDSRLPLFPRKKMDEQQDRPMKRTIKKTISQLSAASDTLPTKPRTAAGHTEKAVWEEHSETSAPLADEEEDKEEESASASDEPASTDSGPDDALGLYLRQMGAIPLLSRKEEVTLAERLERAR